VTTRKRKIRRVILMRRLAGQILPVVKEAS